MTVLGLTGGIACGKSTVAEWLRQLGAAVLDADAISRSLTAPGGAALPVIHKAFGSAVFAADGTLNRAALATCVFADEESRLRLNEILHPMIEHILQQKMEDCRKSGVQIVVLDVPLLYEAGMERLADVVACVSAAEETQVSRLHVRDGLNRQQALLRVQSQWPLREKERRADYVIRTDVSKEEARRQTVQLYRQLVKGAAHDSNSI